MVGGQIKTHSAPPQLDHHLLVCAFGGLVMGATAALLASQLPGSDPTTEVFGWLILGAVHGPLLWPVLARRPWWCTSVVLYAGVIAVAVAAVAGSDLRHVFLAPPVALWLAAWACWRWTTPVASPGCCRICDYDLRGLPESRCPECGTPFGYPDERTAYRMPCLSAASRLEGMRPHSLKDTADAP